MFWKHRRLRLLILCALSAILLSVQYSAYVTKRINPQGTIPFYPESTTYPTGPREYFYATNPTTWYNTEYAPSEQHRDTSPSNASVDITERVEAEIVKKRSLEPFVNAVCLIAGIVLAGIYIFTRQSGPVLGPEAEGLGCVLSTRVLLYWTNYYPSFQTKLYTVLLIMLLLTSIRGLLWWLLGKAPLGWSLIERAAVFAAKAAGKQGYVTVHLLSCTACTLCGAMLYIYGYTWEGVPFGLGMLLSMICAWKFGSQVEYLQKQILRLHENEKLEPAEGLFVESLRQLAGLQERMDEAVRTAVTGERFKVELISNVSHDLRTPLTAILGYGELLDAESLSDEGKLQLRKLNQKAAYMRELVDSVFELTKVSSGAIPPKLEMIDLIRLLEQTLGLFDDELNSAGLQIRRHYCCENLFLITDGSRLHQVFANLVGNAVKYALRGSRVHLHVTQEDDVTSVRMTNISAYEMDFSPEEVLQRFVRGDKARSSKGNGIGLAIAQTYTQSVGGSFRVEIDGEQFSAIVALPKIDTNS